MSSWECSAKLVQTRSHHKPQDPAREVRQPHRSQDRPHQPEVMPELAGSDGPGRGSGRTRQLDRRLSRAGLP